VAETSIIELAMEMELTQFLSKLTIINKEGKQQFLTLTEEQHTIVKALQQGEDTIILKPRQIGSSTIIVAYLFALAYQSKEPITFAILSYKLSSSKHLLNIAKNFYYSLPEPLRRKLDTDNSTELSFEGGGRLIAVASSQRGGLRSFTASKIMLSEFAFSENPEELKATALASLNDGQLIIESTANHFDDCLHKEIIKTQTNQANYNYLFFKWSDHEEYVMDYEGDFQPTDEEIELAEKHELTKPQLAWRREKISKLGWEKFIREYPLDIDEAYRIGGTTYFSYEDLKHIEVANTNATGWVTFQEPIQNHSYAIGVDIGGGVGRDYTVIMVVSKNSGQVVCLHRDNQTSPIAIAEHIATIAQTYNNALVLVEANNYGLATINQVGQSYGRLWKDQKGNDFLTTAKSKPLLFENLKKTIQDGIITTLDNTTMTELRSITTDEKGLIKFSELLDSHSDSAMALALAYWCLQDVKIKEQAYLPEWVLNNRAMKAKTRQASYRRY
jgi:hypothetical protein